MDANMDKRRCTIVLLDNVAEEDAEIMDVMDENV